MKTRDRLPRTLLAILPPGDHCVGCEDACGCCPHAAEAPEPVALERGAGGRAWGSADRWSRDNLGDCCAVKSGGGFCRSRAGVLVELPDGSQARSCSKHLERHLAHQRGEKVRAVKWGTASRVDAEWARDDLWRVQRTINDTLRAGRTEQARRSAAARSAQLELF